MTTSRVHDSSEHFPSMNLPVDIRLMIYESSLQNTITTAFSVPAGQRDLRGDPPYLGVMALARASEVLRKESSDTMRSILEQHLKASIAACRPLGDTLCFMTFMSKTPVELKREVEHQYEDAVEKVHVLKRHDVCFGGAVQPWHATISVTTATRTCFYCLLVNPTFTTCRG